VSLKNNVVSDEYEKLTNCLACDSENLSLYLDLGNQPLANNFTLPGISIETYPLALVYCGNCFHSQLSVSVDPDRLFRNYLYVSNTTETLRKYFAWFADEVVSEYGKNLNVLEIASNDGTLLRTLADRGHNVIGVDPAFNLLPQVLANGVLSISDFWPGVSSLFLENSSNLVVAMNVIAHVPNPCEFLIAARKALKAGGQVILQTSQADMIQSSQFDTAYHEHLSFFNVHSMEALAARSGLTLNDVKLVPIHGTSYLWTLSADDQRVSSRVKARRDEEASAGLYMPVTYSRFASSAKAVVQDTLREVSRLRESGYAVWGYGAAAKGNTFLNFADIKLEGFFDDNELKQGLQSPGGGVSVLSPERMIEIQDPICFMIPAWNFVKEIASRILRIRRDDRDLILTYYPTIRVTSVIEAAEIK
jgi:2-polyprenyl-3-methyl-5-hydroxy-6-metoxy-1,4-benzoquinol methylase